MSTAPRPQQRFRFGVFEADAATGELRKRGTKVRVQEQPFQVLVLLLERRGELVTREEIRQVLWSDDTFVDFDHSLNTIINKLRDALGDSAASPRFIETLARRGYRFIAPVEAMGENAPAAALTNEASAAARSNSQAATAGPASLLSHPDDIPSVPRGLVRVLFSLIQVMYLCFYVISLAKLPAVETVVETAVSRPHWILALVMVTAVVGIPTRLYLLAGVVFDVRDLDRKFQKLFPFVFPLDELWALAPFLAVNQFGVGLAFAATAALLYLPFSQRTLMLMGYRKAER